MSNTKQAVTLYFHSFSAKRHFIKRNNIQASELAAETQSSITIVTDEDFSDSVFVYNITK